jgi:hypothetical protein
MSQNGRREFLTSAAAVAAALAACTAPARRAQAQSCKTIYDEHDIVPKVAPHVHDTVFRDKLITFPAGTSPTMNNLTHGLGPTFVDRTLAALTDPPIQLTSVTVKNTPNPNLPPGLSSGTYDLIPLGTTPGPANPLPPNHGRRSPVVLTKAQASSFDADWSKILMFVIPDPNPVDDSGHPTTPGNSICIHPFGM